MPANRPHGPWALQAELYRVTRDRARPLDRLFSWVTDARNLEAAWLRVCSAEGADTPGLDGVTCTQLAPRSAPWLKRLASELARRSYRPALPRWVEVPKPGDPGAFRRLGILTVRDRVVATALKQVLEPVLEPLFLPCSFGFRPGRSVPAALQEAVRRLTPAAGQAPPFAHAVHLDVAH